MLKKYIDKIIKDNRDKELWLIFLGILIAWNITRIMDIIDKNFLSHHSPYIKIAGSITATAIFIFLLFEIREKQF